MRLGVVTVPFALAALALNSGCGEIPASRDVLATQPVEVNSYHCTMTTFRENFSDRPPVIRKAIDCIGYRNYCQEEPKETDAQCIARIENRFDKLVDF